MANYNYKINKVIGHAKYSFEQRENGALDYEINKPPTHLKYSVEQRAAAMAGYRLTTMADIPAPVVVGDTTPPAIAIISPLTSQSLSRNTPVVFQVTDADSTFARVFISAQHGGTYIEETIHDGISACNGYSVSRTVITDGYNYSIQKIGGWRGTSLTLKIIAIDAAGNIGERVVAEATATYTWQVVEH